MRTRILILSLLCCLVGPRIQAFSFLGPFKSWQTVDLGYAPNFGDIGGPMLPSETYRWNTPVIYYAYDRSFIEYFGQAGIDAIEGAISMLNSVPAASAMSADLSEFPLNTRQVNYEAQALNLFDLRSSALSTILEEMGLANPERWVWTLRSRVVLPDTSIQYAVVKYNYDPITYLPSSYVNGALYTYEVWELANPTMGIAGEVKIGDLRTAGYTSVAGGSGFGREQLVQFEQDPDTGNLVSAGGGALFGQYFFGLTRDDVAGLRRLYGWNNLATESLLPNVDATAGGAWTGSGSTNGVGTNATGTVTTTNTVPPAIRPGVDKVRFQRVSYDSVIGQNFNPFLSRYTDYYITNSTLRSRTVGRLVTQPDLLFVAKDLGVDAAGIPFRVERTTTASWTNNAALNGHDTGIGVPGGGASPDRGGPGVINPSVTIAFSDAYPYWQNLNPGFVSEGTAFTPIVWGSFDGTTNAPVVYPVFGGIPLNLLRQLAVQNPQ
jgi:hypothetical protein